MVDSHSHISELIWNDHPDWLERAKQANVGYVFNMSNRLEEFEAVLKVGRDNPEVFPCLGIHPETYIKGSDIYSPQKPDLDEFEDIVIKNKDNILMIGEIGLDYYIHDAKNLVNESTSLNKSGQKELFERQLQISARLNLPVSVHVRNAFSDAFESIKLNKTDESEVVLHCFTGSYEDLKTAIDRGYYLGVNGIVTYSRAEDLRNIFKKYLGVMKDPEPIDFYNKHILFETDSPLLNPSNSQTKVNEPANVAKIYEFCRKMVAN